MRRGLRIALIGIAGPIALGAMVAGALLTLGNTNWGRQRVELLVASLTSDHVRLQGLGGDLPERLTVRELQLADAHGIWLRAQNIELAWDPWALLTQRIAVHTAHAQRIDWYRRPLSESHDTSRAKIPDIDVRNLSADTVNLGAALVGAPATLKLQASAHLRSLQDMQLTFAATRLDAPGTYSLHLAFDRTRMDGAFDIREPAHGPLAALLRVPAIGAVRVAGDLAGLRQAEHFSLRADLGELHAHATGTVDLVHRSADFEYSADATAMAPGADLSWESLQARGTWHGALTTAVAAAQLHVRALALPDGARLESLDASLEAHAGDLSAHARLAGLSAPGIPAGLLGQAPLTADGSIQFAAPSRPFTVQVTHPTFTVAAKGLAAGARSVDAELKVENVATLLKSVPGQLSGPLRLQVTGQEKGSRLQLHLTGAASLDSTLAALHPWLLGPETADIRADYDAGEWQISKAAAANKALSLTLSGRLSAPKRLGSSWSVAGKSNLALANLSLLLPTLSGRATVQADMDGSLAALHLTGDLQAALAMRGAATDTVRGDFDIADLPRAPRVQVRLRGTLAGAPLVLRTDVQVRPGQTVHISLPQADWRSLHAQGDLTLTEDADRSHGLLKWSIANLADLDPLSGQHLAGSLEGALHLVPVTGPAIATSRQTSLRVTAEGLQIGSFKLNGTLTGAGPLHALRLSLAAQAPVMGTPTRLEAQGLLNVEKSSLQLTALSTAVHGVQVKLRQAATVEFAHGLAIADLNVGLADASLTASGTILPQLQLNAELTDASVGLVDAILPGYLSSGSLKGTVQLHGTVAHPQGQLRLKGTDLRASGDAGSLPAAQLAATVDLATDGARITLQSSVAKTSHMTVAGTILWRGPIAVNARGNFDLARLSPLLESSGQSISGTIDLNAQVAGTVEAPTVKGAVHLRKGAIHDYRHGIDLTDVEGTLEGTQNELRITKLTASAASGTLSVTGTLGVLQEGWPVDLHFTARNAQPFSSSIVTGNVNADLTLQGTALHELTVAGTVHINHATVEIPNNFPPNVAVLDVRRPGQNVATAAAAGPVINLKVAIDAPRQILVRGRGLDAELGGKVQIGGTTAAPTIGGGFHLLRGQFTLASSHLNFTSGRVSFAGSDVTGKIDPTLDFTAQTTALDATVTLRITGVADAPVFDLTSVPQLPQDEILARLLFGENAGQLTALQAAQLGAALVTLTGVGTGLNPLEEVQKHLGLDRLAVGSNESPGSTQSSGATIEAGRYVTNRIFVNLKQNTTGATQLQVDVDLTKKLKLQTRIGTGTATLQGTTPENDPGSSVGLSYRFEY